jgi:hypothetical protein
MKQRFVITLVVSFFVACFSAASARAQVAQPSPQPPATAAAVQAAPQIPPANPADVASIDSIISALYDVISGPAGKKRDWDRFSGIVELLHLSSRRDDREESGLEPRPRQTQLQAELRMRW